MGSKKILFQYLLVGLLILLIFLPGGFTRAATGLPRTQSGFCLSPGERDTNIQMISAEGSASVNLTTPAPDPTGAVIEKGTSNTTPSVPFTLIMGIGFIFAAVVLIFIAVKRGDKKE